MLVKMTSSNSQLFLDFGSYEKSDRVESSSGELAFIQRCKSGACSCVPSACSSCYRMIVGRLHYTMSRLNLRTCFIFSLCVLIVFTLSAAIDSNKEFKLPEIRALLHPNAKTWDTSPANAIPETRVRHEDYGKYPWTFVCVENKCQRILVDASSQAAKVSFDVCWLTCGNSGSLWPAPAQVKLSRTAARFYPENFFIRETSGPTDYVKSLTSLAANVTRMAIKKMLVERGQNGRTSSGVDEPRYHSPESTIVEVQLSADEATTTISESTDESYEMRISSVTMGTGALINVNIKGATFFGVRHGLETLSQLIAYDEIGGCLQIVDDVAIKDGPSYPIRGLMLDTARNFIPLDNIYSMIDAMSYNKMNTLHWHITDSNSFPFQSKKVPQMSLYGAYAPNKIYTIEDIKNMVFYALVRGVRIIPELDAPAHTGNGWQWGHTEGLGELAVCVGKEPWRSFCGQPPCGQLNPTNENVYLILQRLYEDFLEAFEVDTFHVGGDEVISNCWDGIPHMKEYMHEHNLQTHLDVWGNFHNQSYQRLKAANQNKPITAIVWSSGLTGSSVGKRYLDPRHFVVQIWETGTSYQIGDLLKNNYRLIFSNVDAMYLDFGQGSWLGGEHDYKYHNWQVFYDNDLDRIISRSTNGKPQLVSQYAKLVLGGIATLWTEKVNENTMDAKLWPRGAALAERLWTNPKTRRDDVVYARLNHQTKRLKARGVRCATLQPFSCLQMTGNCNDPQNPLR